MTNHPPAPRSTSRLGVHTLLPLLLALPAGAQIIGGVSATPAGRWVLGAEHLGGLPGAMTRTVSGDWTGDLRPDACVLLGNQPVFLFNAGLHHALTDLPATGKELANLRRGAPDGHDALLVASARGLESWWLEDDSQTFAVASIGGTPWEGAQRLRSGDLLGDGTQGAVGLRQDRLGLVLRTQATDPATEVLLDAGTYSIVDFDLIQWDGLAGLELAMLTSEGAKITDLELRPLATYAVGDDGDHLCVLRQPGVGYDRLATVVELGTSEWLFCADRNQLDPGVLLGDVDMVGMVAADFDADGQEDLVLSHRTTGELALFYNQLLENGASFSLATGAVELYDLTPDQSGPDPAPWNDGVPLFVDLDADGDADVLHPMNKDKSVVLMRSEAIDHRAFVPVPSSGCYQYESATGFTRVALTLEAPAQIKGTPNVLEIVVWRQDTAGAPTDPVPVSVQVVGAPGFPLPIEVEFVEPLPSTALHHVQLRLGEIGGPLGRSAGPSYVHGLTASSESASEALELHGVDPAEVLVLDVVELGETCEPDPLMGPGTVTTTGRGTVGGSGGYIPVSGDEGASGVPLTCVPCFSDGWVPWGV